MVVTLINLDVDLIVILSPIVVDLKVPFLSGKVCGDLIQGSRNRSTHLIVFFYVQQNLSIFKRNASLLDFVALLDRKKIKKLSKVRISEARGANNAKDSIHIPSIFAYLRRFLAKTSIINHRSF